VAEGADGVDGQSFASGTKARAYSHGGQNGGDGRERERVNGADLKQEPTDGAGQYSGRGAAYSKAWQNQARDVCEQQTQSVGACGAESRTDSDLFGSTSRSIRHYAIDAN
jgi:hypothetical protein